MLQKLTTDTIAPSQNAKPGTLMSFNLRISNTLFTMLSIVYAITAPSVVRAIFGAYLVIAVMYQARSFVLPPTDVTRIRVMNTLSLMFLIIGALTALSLRPVYAAIVSPLLAVVFLYLLFKTRRILTQNVGIETRPMTEYAIAVLVLVIALIYASAFAALLSNAPSQESLINAASISVSAAVLLVFFVLTRAGRRLFPRRDFHFALLGGASFCSILAALVRVTVNESVWLILTTLITSFALLSLGISAEPAEPETATGGSAG